MDLYRYAYSILRNDEDAKDAVQETYTRYFEKEKTFRGEASEKTMLLVIVRNYCYSRLALKENGNIRLEEEICNTAHHPLYEEELTLKEALAKLSAPQNELFFLKVHCRYSNAEIAAMTGLTADNVTVRLFRIREFLKKCLEERNEPVRIPNK